MAKQDKKKTKTKTKKHHPFVHFFAVTARLPGENAQFHALQYQLVKDVNKQ